MDEYIERAQAIKAVCDSIPHSCSLDDCQKECQEVSAIVSVPAADVRPVVRAHWYWDKDGMDWNIGAWRCSACKAMSPMWWNTDRGSPMHKSGHKFCPNCGAMMEES